MADQWRLTTSDFLTQLATLAFLNGGEEGKNLYNSYLVGRTGYELYQRLKEKSVPNEAEILRQQTISSIAEYVKKNPRASEGQLKSELNRQITSFAKNVAALEKYK
ncbi:uncharacterized protein LOC124442525 [Xenia sp. Carnegie-2017]|uniref:uncharacterized protein LOC124442525 n=1 Tax=Xenia sp. Carnegie-2017 TaxID=2897299 RepID=UPI001F035E36|nr:uncharacterized protein LOC124442525 [Xenia sp. Carnegie-2017]